MASKRYCYEDLDDYIDQDEITGSNFRTDLEPSVAINPQNLTSGTSQQMREMSIQKIQTNPVSSVPGITSEATSIERSAGVDSLTESSTVSLRHGFSENASASERVMLTFIYW